ncbi:MAG TPA: flagellar assembly protein FliW [Bacteroidetes bacterium]|nr:flagellar assembly protein FliW [Bacteroidota bacterium]
MLGVKTKSNTYYLETGRWGTLEINPDETIHFPRGIPGFESCRHFAIFDTADMKPFRWLICLDDSQTGFVIIDPLLFCADYYPKLFNSDLSETGYSKSDRISLYAIVTISNDPKESTANLQGPLLINLTKKMGKQIVVVDERYSVKYKILKE